MLVSFIYKDILLHLFINKMDNEYKITKCVSTYDIQKKYMKGIIENIKIEKHRIIIKTNKMIYIIKNKVNFFSCENNEKYIGCKILSWKYYGKNFIFKMKGENMIVNINGTNENKIFYGKRLLPKVFGIIEKINITNHRIIIKTNLVVIKIKNTEDIYYDDDDTNTLIGDILVGLNIIPRIIDIKVENPSKCRRVKIDYYSNDYDNKITLYKVDTYMQKSKYGKVKKVKINKWEIKIKTTRGVFTFTSYYDDDGLYSEDCPELYENINDIIGKEIITIESEDHNKIIHCNGNAYLIATRNYDDDEYVYPHVRYGIKCHEFFF